ncbi:MAG TPA: transketolase [Acidimicrobiales bacterium]|nr:transketolase [Acidimicrobiales bacterium]
MTSPDLEARAISVVRGLSMDAPHAARSGHQGTAMALAPLAHVLWTRIMRYDASDPEWPDRDRFVLSAGHASILLYSMLHLTGHGLTLEDLKAFRQWGSATPGHPERGHTAGVEVTTGPLGQGIANAVGMAIAERSLRARFGTDLVDHRTFCIAGDGDLSEGVSHEAASLAGHLGLGRLICVYDDNRITIDGTTDLALSDDAAKRFEAYGWHVLELGEAADDLDALEAGLRAAMAEEDRPSLVILRSHIAHPSPSKTDDPAAHGYALKDEEIREAKQVLGLPVDEPFYVPDDVLAWYREAGARGAEARAAWEKRLEAYDGDRAVLDACFDATGLAGWTEALPRWEPGERVATRVASGACLQALADVVPALVAGGADLTSNTGTVLAGHGVQSREEPGGRQLYFGIREHAMAAAMNGMALHGGVLPVGGTFLVFSDYCRPAIRLAALSRAKVIYAFTHDSVGVGEDGPTHQPIEHVASLRAIPDLLVLRPADANETAAAWRIAVEHDGPTALILSRQDLPVLDGTAGAPVERGGYVLRPADDPDVVLVATGSEVSVAVDAAEGLAAEGVAAQVVSLPSWELLAEQPEEYLNEVLPPEVPTLAVEAGATLGWERWADDVVGIDRFGASAPGSRVLAELGFTAANVAARARELIDELEEVT